MVQLDTFFFKNFYAQVQWLDVMDTKEKVVSGTERFGPPANGATGPRGDPGAPGPLGLTGTRPQGSIGPVDKVCQHKRAAWALLTMTEDNLILYGPARSGKTWLVQVYMKSLTEAERGDIVHFEGPYSVFASKKRCICTTNELGSGWSTLFAHAVFVDACNC